VPRPCVTTSAVVAALGVVRAAVGVVLILTPERFVTHDGVARQAVPSVALLARTVGIRDVALGLGTVVAARGGQPADVRRWVRIGLVSDGGDVLAGLAAVPRLGTRAIPAALIPVPVIAADLLLLRRLGR